MFPTVKDVAKRAGVSPSTVSRVIADHPRISEATKRKVRAAMKELNYHPNAVARSLVRRRTHTIGVALSRSAEAALANPFFPEVLRGIGAVAREAGYSITLTTRTFRRRRTGAMYRAADAAARRRTYRPRLPAPTTPSSIGSSSKRIRSSCWAGCPAETFPTSTTTTFSPLVRRRSICSSSGTGTSLSSAARPISSSASTVLKATSKHSTPPAFLSDLTSSLSPISVTNNHMMRLVGCFPRRSQRVDPHEASTSNSARRPTALVAIDDSVALGAWRRRGIWACGCLTTCPSSASTIRRFARTWRRL